MARVFVTDAQQRKAVPIVRSLGRQGIDVVAGDSTRWSMAFLSKYCVQGVVYPSPIETPHRFVEWLIEHLKRHRYDALFPIDERTMGPVTRHREELERYTAVPVVDHATYLKARDKAETIRAAMDLGIPCPQTHFISSLNEVKGLAERVKPPLVIKPRCSQGSRGIVYVRPPDDVYFHYRRVHAQHPFPLIQEFIPSGGDALGVEVLLSRDSEPRAAFAHRRLREYPISGGPSTLREGIRAPELVEMSLELLRALGWFGVAMVEFKVDPRDGTPKLMEINPKFWGSIQLPIASGVNFPYLLYRLATEGDIEPGDGYSAGVRCRWLLPGDILNFLSNPDRFRLRPSFFQFRRPDLHYDILSRDDPGPVFGMFVSYLAQALNGKAWRDLRR